MLQPYIESSIALSDRYNNNAIRFQLCVGTLKKDLCMLFY